MGSGSGSPRRWGPEGHSEERCCLATERRTGEGKSYVERGAMCEHKHHTRLTGGAHVNERVVDQHQFVEVEFIGEPLAFGLVKDPLVVVVSVRAQQQR